MLNQPPRSVLSSLRLRPVLSLQKVHIILYLINYGSRRITERFNEVVEVHSI